MILAAGVGSRLDPLTRNVPKPMVPVVNQPVMEHIVHLLVWHGFTDIFCNTHYLADQIESYFQDGQALGAQMRYNREEELMGTAGGVKRVAQEKKFFDDGETFLVIGGDDLTGIDLSAMLEFHKAKGALATIGLTRVDDPSQFGVVVVDEEGAIGNFVEKPAPGTAPSNLVNMGVYLLDPAVLELIPDGQFYDFGKELFPLLLEKDKPFYGYETDAFWRDVGNLREYRECHDDFFESKIELEVNVPPQSEGVWIGSDCHIHETAIIEGNCLIGPNCTVGPAARIGRNSVLGEGCIVGAAATVYQSILWARSEIKPETHVERCVVGFDCHAFSNAAIFDGTIVPPLSRNGK